MQWLSAIGIVGLRRRQLFENLPDEESVRRRAGVEQGLEASACANGGV